jgi:putative ABC transport system permease protein
MRLVQNIALALGVICARPARSALMALTLGAGAGAATLVAAVLGGYGAQMERMVFGAYARSLVITENRLVPDRFGAPRRSDLDRLLEDLGVPVDGAAAWRNDRAEVRSERERL